MLPAGTVNTPWKRLPTGVWVPGFPQVPSGRDVNSTQELMRAIYVAAGQKAVTFCCSAGFAVKQQTTAGRANRNYNICSNRLDWVQASAAAEPVWNSSDALFGGKASFQVQGSRYFLNATDPAAPGTTPLYVKMVCVLDSWPPGGRCWFGASANRYGVYTRSTPDSLVLSNSTLSDPVDQPLGRAGVLTFCMRNSASAYPNGDFVQFGAAANRASGKSAGNTNPASVAIGAINTGGQGIVGRWTFLIGFTQALTNAESEAVDDLLNAEYGGALLIYSSVGNIRSAGIGWLGSSQTRGDAVYAYDGARYTFWHNYGDPTGLNYPTWTSGLATNGTFPQPAHTGISAQGINVDGGGANPGSGLAVANAYFNPAGATPSSGAGAYRYINLELGGADCNAGLWVAGTTAADLLTIAKQLATTNPNACVGINTIPCQSGDPASVAAFSAEIRDPGGIWDQFDTWAAANSRLNCARPDPNNAVGGGSYNAAYYIDALHYNLTGQGLWGAEINTKTATPMNLATTY